MLGAENYPHSILWALAGYCGWHKGVVPSPWAERRECSTQCNVPCPFANFEVRIKATEGERDKKGRIIYIEKEYISEE